MDVNTYSPQIILAACVTAFLAMLLILWGVTHQGNLRRTATLRERFGPEYDVALKEYGSPGKAEDALTARLRHVSALNLRPLDETQRRLYLSQWDAIHARFVDHPRGAVTEADILIGSVLSARGYTGGRFEQRVAEISVHHAPLVGPYRRAHTILARAGKNEGITTEELSSAMILYGTLLDDLLQTRTVTMPRAQAA